MLTLLVAYAVAELLTGLFHWWEDTYGNPSWPIIGPLIVRPNQIHHARPAAFLAGGYWYRNWTTIAPALVAAAVCWQWPVLCWAFLITTQANEVHGWAHQRCSRPIRWLQAAGIIQGPTHHHRHHTGRHDTAYCTLTGWANPVLDRLHVWRGLEWLVYAASGILPRRFA